MGGWADGRTAAGAQRTGGRGAPTRRAPRAPPPRAPRVFIYPPLVPKFISGIWGMRERVGGCLQAGEAEGVGGRADGDCSTVPGGRWAEVPPGGCRGASRCLLGAVCGCAIRRGRLADGRFALCRGKPDGRVSREGLKRADAVGDPVGGVFELVSALRATGAPLGLCLFRERGSNQPD